MPIDRHWLTSGSMPQLTPGRLRVCAGHNTSRSILISIRFNLIGAAKRGQIPRYFSQIHLVPSRCYHTVLCSIRFSDENVKYGWIYQGEGRKDLFRMKNSENHIYLYSMTNSNIIYKFVRYLKIFKSILFLSFFFLFLLLLSP